MITLSKQRKAFSMLTAIFLIVIMASIAAFVMNLSGKMTKITTHQYQKEQAMLLAKSYTEYAVMTVMANDRIANDCIENINANNIVPPGNMPNININYNVSVNIGYIGAAADIATCAGTRQFGNPATSDELNIIVDVYVQYPDFDTGRISRYHRRTLQKI